MTDAPKEIWLNVFDGVEEDSFNEIDDEDITWSCDPGDVRYVLYDKVLEDMRRMYGVLDNIGEHLGEDYDGTVSVVSPVLADIAREYPEVKEDDNGPDNNMV